MLHTNSRGEEGIFYKVPGRMGVYTLKVSKENTMWFFCYFTQIIINRGDYILPQNLTLFVCFYLSISLLYPSHENNILCVIYSLYAEGHIRCGEGAVWGWVWGKQWQSLWLQKHRKQRQCHHSRGQERTMDAERYCGLYTASLITVWTSLTIQYS